MKRKRIYLSLLVTMLLGLLPGAVRAQDAVPSTVYLPIVATQTTQQAPADQPVVTSAEQSAPSGPGIEITPLSVILTGPGDDDWFEATIYDEKGNVVNDTVTWEEDDPDEVVKLTEINGNSVTVYAQGPIGSATVTALYGEFKRSISIVVATLGDNTRFIDHRLVLYDESTPGVVALGLSQETKNLQPGEILVSNPVSAERPGLLARVTGIKEVGSVVRLAYEPAALAEAFQEFHAHGQGDPVAVNLTAAPGGQSVQASFSNGNQSLDALTCQVTSGAGQIQATLISISEQPIQIVPSGMLTSNGSPSPAFFWPSTW